MSARLTWEPAAGARSYRVAVAEDPEFQKVGGRDGRHASRRRSLETLPPERTLYWRVEAISWGGRRASAGQPGTFVTPRLDRPAGLAFLSEIPWVKANAGADNPVRRDVNYYGKPIAINGQLYPKGLWTHAYPDATPADVVYDVSGGKFELFKADVGLDDASGGGSVQFQVLVDGVQKAESPVLAPRQVHRFRVNVAGAREITLRVLNGDDGYTCDHAAWAPHDCSNPASATRWMTTNPGLPGVCHTRSGLPSRPASLRHAEGPCRFSGRPVLRACIPRQR